MKMRIFMKKSLEILIFASFSIALTDMFNFNEDDEEIVPIDESDSVDSKYIKETIALDYVFKANTDDEWDFSDMVDEALAVIRINLEEQGPISIDGTVLDCSDSASIPMPRCEEVPKKEAYNYLIIKERTKDVKYSLDMQKNGNFEKLVKTLIKILSRHTKKDLKNMKFQPKPPIEFDDEIKDAIDKIKTTQSTARSTIDRKKEMCSKKDAKKNEEKLPEEMDILDEWLVHLHDPICVKCPMESKELDEVDDVKKLAKILKNNHWVFIMFWTHVSKYSFSLWSNASVIIGEKSIDAKIAAVNCGEHPQICTSYEIYHWPKLLAFKNGEKHSTFDKIQDVKLYSDWVIMLTQNRLLELETSNMKRMQVGKLPGFEGEIRSAITMGTFSDNNSAEYMQFEKVAAKLHGHYHLAVEFNSKIKPSIRTIKPKEMFENKVEYSGKFKLDDIMEFVKKSSIPTIIPLNGYTFSLLHNLGKPFLLLLSPRNGYEQELIIPFAKMAIDPVFRSKLAFSRAISDESELTPLLLKRYKLTKENLPILAFVNSDKDQVLTFRKADEMGKQGLLEWTQAIFDGQIHYPLAMNRVDYTVKSIDFQDLGLFFVSEYLKPPISETLSREVEEKRRNIPNPRYQLSPEPKLTNLKHREL